MTKQELKRQLLAQHASGAGPYCPYCRNARKAQLKDPIGFDIRSHIAECLKRFPKRVRMSKEVA